MIYEPLDHNLMIFGLQKSKSRCECGRAYRLILYKSVKINNNAFYVFNNCWFLRHGHKISQNLITAL